VKEEKKSLLKKQKSEEASLAKLQTSAEAHDDVVNELSTDIDELVAKEKTLEEDYQQLKTSGIGLTETLTPEQEAEYEKIREVSGVASAPARSVLQKKVRALETARAKSSNLEDELKEIEGRRDDAKKSSSELTQRKEVLSQR